jgi:hypothetical protein
MGSKGWCLKKRFKPIRSKGKCARGTPQTSRLSINQKKYFYFNIKPEKPSKNSKTSRLQT